MGAMPRGLQQKCTGLLWGRTAEFGSRLCNSLAAWLWASYTVLQFFIWEIGTVNIKVKRVFIKLLTVSKREYVCMLSCFSPVQLCDPMDCSLLGCVGHGILQARMECVAVPSSRGSS